MKTRLLLFIVLVISLTVSAHDNYMSLCFGRGMAQGDFARTEDIFNHGYALGGFAANYSGAYYPMKYMGICGSIGFNTNYIDADKAGDALVALIPKDQIPDNANIGYNMGQWNMVSMHVGPQFTLPAGNFSFDFFLLGGLDIVFSPKFEVTISEEGNPGNFYYTTLSSNKASLGFDGGMALRYQFNDNAGFRIFMNYVQTSTKGELRRELDLGSSDESLDYKTKIQILNFGIGLVYRI